MSNESWTAADLAEMAVSEAALASWPHTRIAGMLKAGAEALRTLEGQTINVDQMRANLHATFNGGYHETGDLRAFHHGMDTVCNVFAAHQRGECTNGILPERGWSAKETP